MLFFKEIHHKTGLNLSGTGIFRSAVRAVILQGDRILLVYSKKNDEYKFPGGGVNTNEEPDDALRREVSEETGAEVTKIGKKLGTVVEYDRESGDEADYFRMTSDYYAVEIEDYLKNQRLDAYEAELEFIPRWTLLVDAERKNRTQMETNKDQVTKWIRREAYVLRELLIRASDRLM